MRQAERDIQGNRSLNGDRLQSEAPSRAADQYVDAGSETHADLPRGTDVFASKGSRWGAGGGREPDRCGRRGGFALGRQRQQVRLPVADMQEKCLRRHVRAEELALLALHVELEIEADVLAAIEASSLWGEGFRTAEYLGATMLDLAWHSLAPGTVVVPRRRGARTAT